MRPLIEHDYYELLDLPQNGTERQLERAYRIARATYSPVSVATYSIFSDQESAAILRRVEEAYVVLSDARLRREYDRRLRREAKEEAQPPQLRPPEAASAPAAVWSREPLRPDSLELDEALEPEDGNYDGEVLRRIRLELGMELEEIATITKVNPYFLESLEGNCYDELPSSVYVRGFVKEVAKCLGLDASQVADSYMKGYAEASKGKG